MEHNDNINGAIFDKNEERILSWSDDYTIRLWSVQTGTQIGKPMKHNGHVNGAIFDKNEKCILSWGEDNTIRLWDIHNGEQIGRVMKHSRPVVKALFDSKENGILSWSEDGTIKLWDIPGDLDLPKDDFLLQTQVTTGTIYNENTDVLEVIPPAEWQEKKKAWLKKAKAHAKKCQYPHQNVFINYYATEQDSIELGLMEVQ